MGVRFEAETATHQAWCALTRCLLSRPSGAGAIYHTINLHNDSTEAASQAVHSQKRMIFNLMSAEHRKPV